MQVGKRIRELREARKMKLIDLAEISGVQIATLSRIENGKMTGTLESHQQIARALGIELAQLYQNLPDEPSAEPVSQHEAESFSYNDKAAYEILTSRVNYKKMLPMVLRIETGGSTNEEQNKIGTEKFVFVLEGKIVAAVGDKSYPLSAQQSLYFDATRKHHFENAGKKTAKLIVVQSPVEW